MKTIHMDRDFYYRPNARAVVKYIAGKKYDRVPEAAAAAILDAKAGSIVTVTVPPVNSFDA